MTWLSYLESRREVSSSTRQSISPCPSPFCAEKHDYPAFTGPVCCGTHVCSACTILGSLTLQTLWASKLPHTFLELSMSGWWKIGTLSNTSWHTKKPRIRECDWPHVPWRVTRGASSVPVWFSTTSRFVCPLRGVQGVELEHVCNW